MARIGIDARFFGPIGKGLGRYTQKLIEYLEVVDQDNQYFVFLGKDNFETYKPKNPNFQKVLADFRWYSFAEQLKMPLLLYRYNLDLVHFPHFNVPIAYFKPFVITIHDLILLHFPTVRASTLGPLKYWLKFTAYRLTIFSAIKRARRIIAVSEFTKKDILEHYKVKSGKVTVTYEACDKSKLDSSPDDGVVLAKYGIIKPYFLYVGNVYPHKNPERLIKTFKKIQDRGREEKLVFVGGDDYFYIRLKKFAADQNVRNVVFAGFVPDEELNALFHGAVAYVRPSLYEGFELPPLEAMSAGVPVLSSSHDCALEILGDSAAYFDAYDSDDILRAIEEISGDDELRARLVEKGYAQVKKYNWEKMAKQTSDIFKKALNK